MYNKYGINFPLMINLHSGRYVPKIVANHSNYIGVWSAKNGINNPGVAEVINLSNSTISDYVLTNDETVDSYETDSENNQKDASICVLNNGNIVLVWANNHLDGSGYGIYAKILDSNKQVIKADFKINDYVSSNQEYPVLAALQNGNFIIVWQSLGQDTVKLTTGIYGQIHDQNGEILVPEFRINDYVLSNQERPDVAVKNNGDIVIVWHSFTQDGSENGIFCKVYNMSGVMVHAEFLVNGYTLNHQEYPKITVLKNDNIVITWQSYQQTTPNYEIFAQIFAGNYTKIGNEFAVYSGGVNNQKYPNIASFDNNFIITWQSQINGKYVILAKAYSETENNVLIDAFQVDDNNSAVNLEFSSITAQQNGNFVILWQRLEPNICNYIVEGKLFVGSNFTDGIVTVPDTESLIVNTTIANVTDITNTTTTAPAYQLNMSSSNETAPMVSETTSASNIVETTTADTATTNAPISTNAETTTVNVAQTNVISSAPETTLASDTSLTQNENNVEIPTVAPVVSSSSSNASKEVIIGNFSNIEVVNSTNIIINGTAGVIAEYIFSNYVKYALIYSGGSADNFVFGVSSNSLIQIENFGDEAVLNLTQVGNYTSYKQLNITSGSTHIHLPGNQTIIITNKYPDELNASNFVFTTAKNIEIPTETPNQHNIENKSLDTGSSIFGTSFIVGLTLGGVIFTGSLIGGVIACVTLYKHKHAVKVAAMKITTNIVEHLPFGDEQGDVPTVIVVDTSPLSQDVS